ncbi:lysine-specific demethylase no66-like [Stylonychia lemnae]|uniref:Lysine-specific demethylase no66-like n=1 Tax=Stylonychia lemnae TaxID=5949 RepID=A0A078AXT4_STYLE|nr:lysine-specific demethylase no66-like [Stylonychia lemnae]|eukprot:CDW85608.1 lysine-specific demethylase no66-like [Stylonychia lemnae]
MIIKPKQNILKQAEVINQENLFEALIFPMRREEFFEKIFTKKALVIKGFSSKRFKQIVEEQMFDLDLKQMCENTASENIHIWFPKQKQDQQKVKSQKNNKNALKDQDLTIKSIETEDPDLACVSYQRGGASLYFGSSLEFRNIYCKSLAFQMGMNFGAYFTDFSTMGEIETFWSRKGNLTDYHIDFQENFTLQIRGSKIWRFRRSGLEQPLLGYTPHYQNTGNIEEQSKVHLNYHSIDINKQYQNVRDEVYEVQLNEGDILYHPAGIWHQVECVSDESISINFSLRQLRQLECCYQPKFLMPPCLMIPRILKFDLDKSVEKNGKKYSVNLNKDSIVTLNPFYTINKVTDFPQIPKELSEAQYVINGLYGNEDFSSQVRVQIIAKSKQSQSICDLLIKLETKISPQREKTIAVRSQWTLGTLIKLSNLAFNSGLIDIQLKNLIFNGVLVLV